MLFRIRFLNCIVWNLIVQMACFLDLGTTVHFKITSIVLILKWLSHLDNKTDYCLIADAIWDEAQIILCALKREMSSLFHLQQSWCAESLETAKPGSHFGAPWFPKMLSSGSSCSLEMCVSCHLKQEDVLKKLRVENLYPHLSDDFMPLSGLHK